MDRFYLFRLKLVNKKNQELLKELNRGQLLLKIIKLHPGAYVRRGIEWIMANTNEINPDSVFFKFGRLTRKTRDKFDLDKRLFIETEDDMVDSTICVYDSINQILALEKCSNTPPPSTLAKHIRHIINTLPEGPLFQYLSSDERTFLSLCTCQIDAIPNPVDFIGQISSAYKILEFDVTFFRKNPPDHNELLQKPMQNLLEETNGYTSTASVSSPDGLKPDALISLTHAAAASGSKASAKIQKQIESRSERVRLDSKDNIASFDFEEGDHNDRIWLSSLLDVIRDKYHKIRGN